MLRKTPNYAPLGHIFFNFHNILLAASLQNSFFPKTICAAQRDAVCEGVTKVANFYLCRSTRSTSSKALTWCILWWFRSWRCLIDYVVVQQKVKSVDQVKEKSCRVAHYFQQQGYKKGEVREEKRELEQVWGNGFRKLRSIWTLRCSGSRSGDGEQSRLLLLLDRWDFYKQPLSQSLATTTPTKNTNSNTCL